MILSQMKLWNFRKFKNKIYTNSSNEKEVLELNNTQFLASDDIIISSRTNELYKFNNKVKRSGFNPTEKLR